MNKHFHRLLSGLGTLGLGLLIVCLVGLPIWGLAWIATQGFFGVVIVVFTFVVGFAYFLGYLDDL